MFWSLQLVSRKKTSTFSARVRQDGLTYCRYGRVDSIVPSPDLGGDLLLILVGGSCWLGLAMGSVHFSPTHPRSS